MKNAKQFSLSAKDMIKSLIMAMITVVVTMLYTAIDAGVFPTDWTHWKVILLSALGAGLSYILKNWLTNSDDQFLKKEGTADAN